MHGTVAYGVRSFVPTSLVLQMLCLHLFPNLKTLSLINQVRYTI